MTTLANRLEAGQSIRVPASLAADLLPEAARHLTVAGVNHVRLRTSPATSGLAGAALEGALPGETSDLPGGGVSTTWVRSALMGLERAARVILVDRGEWLDELSAFVIAQAVTRGTASLLVATGADANLPEVLQAMEESGDIRWWRAEHASTRLTSREHEVAALARRGLSSREIAYSLFLSVRTVDNHLQRTYAKLGIRSRRELALCHPALGR